MWNYVIQFFTKQQCNIAKSGKGYFFSTIDQLTRYNAFLKHYSLIVKLFYRYNILELSLNFITSHCIVGCLQLVTPSSSLITHKGLRHIERFIMSLGRWWVRRWHVRMQQCRQWAVCLLWRWWWSQWQGFPLDFSVFSLESWLWTSRWDS